jgi:hypothetical protein
LPLPFPPVFLLLFCSAICFAVAVPDSRVDNLQAPVLLTQTAHYFRLYVNQPEWLSSYCKFNGLVDVRRSFYCITTGVEARVLEGRQNTFWREVFTAHISEATVPRTKSILQRRLPSAAMSAADRLESFKNFKNSVENVAFQGSPSPSSRTRPAKPLP